MSTLASTGCSVCNKSSLSLILFRPSPIAKTGALVPPGSAAVVSNPSLTQGLVPAKAPSQSRYVLRSLRAGYVHVYIANPPPGMKQWMDYRVTEQADLVPETDVLFSQPQASVQCGSRTHNAAGLRLLTIPQAHRLSSIWIAFSANRWSDKIKARNAANPEVMQQINLNGGGPNTFKPTADLLRKFVLDAGLMNLSINGAKEHDFAFNSLAPMADKLAADLLHAAACHPKTAGKELAIVLRDPVGVATELNALRLRRSEMADQEVAKPENAHPLNSSNTLLGIKQSVLDERLAESFQQVTPMKTKAAFDQSTGYPAGTQWQRLTQEQQQTLLKAASGDNWFTTILRAPYKSFYEQNDIGWVLYPDHEERAAKWAHEQTEKTWKQFADKYDENARLAWMNRFEAKMREQHYDALALFERDWVDALLDPVTLDSFKHHFDPYDPNNPKESHSPGTIYAAEVHRAFTPSASTSDAIISDYLNLFKPAMTDQRSVMLRALLANQHYAIEQAIPEIDQNKRDKLYDLMKGLVLGAQETETPNAAQRLMRRYGWLGDVVGGYSLGIWGSAVSGLTTLMARNTQAARSWSWLNQKIQGMGMVRQATDLALQATVSGQGMKVPVLVKARVPIDEAMALLRDRSGQQLGLSRTQLKRLKQTQSTIELTLLTDSHSLAQAQGDAKKLMQAPESGIKLGGAGRAQAAGALSGTVMLTTDEFARLYRTQTPLTASAAKALKHSLEDAKSIVRGLDGRLAIGSVVIQCIGLLNNLNDLKSDDLKKMRDAWYGVSDSAAGMIGGLMEMWVVLYSNRLQSTASAAVLQQSTKLAGLKVAAAFTGFIGGLVNALHARVKAEDESIKGNHAAAGLYRASSFAFAGTSLIAIGASAGSIAQVFAARQIGGMVAQRTAAAVGARMAAPMLGLTLTGWGLVLLGAGMVFQVGAAILTPTPLQKWIGRSYFGNESKDEKFPQGDWAAELKGLNEALKEVQGQ